MAEPFRILEVNKAYYPHVGGIETLVKQYSEELGAIEGVEVRTLVCRDGRGKTCRETVNGVKLTRAGSFGTYFSCPVSMSFIRLFRKMAAQSDAVHINVPFPLADLALLLSGYRGRVVVSWHSDIVKQKKLLKLYSPLLRRLLRRADAIAVATEGHISGSDWLPEFREKCTVVPYGIVPDDYNVPGNGFLTKKCTVPGSVKLFFTGRLVYYKGVETLIKAMGFADSPECRCELFIAGTGVLEAELRAEARRLGKEDHIHFLGFLPEKELRQAYADCDIFILPSTEKSEAFGIVQLEAMACGKPVINTLLPSGVPHVSLNGITGYTVPPGDYESLAGAIVRLAKNPGLREKMGKAGSERVSTVFREDRVIDTLYKVLRK